MAVIVEAKFLGVLFGPGAAKNVWADAQTKAKKRSIALRESSAPPSFNAYLYNTRKTPVYSFLGQICSTPPRMVQEELCNATRALRQPPNTFTYKAMITLDLVTGLDALMLGFVDLWPNINQNSMENPERIVLIDALML